MKIYNRTEFMRLPGDTIYCKGKPWYWEQIAVKSDTTEHNDFFMMHLNNIESSDSDEWATRQQEMLTTGISYPLEDDCYGRDGCFDNEDIFMVYEKPDIEKLINILQKALT